MNYKSFLILFTLAVAVVACKEGPKDDDKPVTFKELFGDCNKLHLWNMANSSFVSVTTAPGTNSVAVFTKYCNRLHRLAEKSNPSATEIMQFDVTDDITEIIVVVDGRVYTTAPGGSVDASTHNGSIAGDVYDDVPMFGWLLVGEYSESQDWDFNDIVARLEPQPDGSLNVTAMCMGVSERVWLHFTNGDTDYVISPKAFNGFCEETTSINRFDAFEYEWCNWFSTKKEEYFMGGFSVNVFGVGGTNDRVGQTVNIPASILGSQFHIALSGISEIHKEKGKNKHDFAMPTFGFYVTVDAYDYTNLDAMKDDKERTIYSTLISSWPAGHDPQLLIIPDASSLDTPERFVGWQWPTEGSRIDLVYPQFIDWVKDPYCNWYQGQPSGWDDRHAVLDDNGTFIYWGYYPR